jgi:disulfide bond formation protein DsbB
MPHRLSRLLNALGLLAISAVLATAFADQLINRELPCPLCILQRAGFVLAGVGLAMNLVFGQRASHYALSILGAAAGGAIAMRQVLLHIVPGTGAYGDPFLGLHYYTWAALLFALIIVGSALLLLADTRFNDQAMEPPPPSWLARGALILFTLMVLGNVLSTFLECGLGLCPDNPSGYQLLEPSSSG